jgi:hypothetical protein
MPPQTALLLDRVSPAVRLALVRARILAMRGRMTDAVVALEGATGADATDIIARGLLRAELAYLNQDGPSATNLIRSEVLPVFDALDPVAQFVVEENLVDAQMSGSTIDAVRLFYHVVDRRRLAGFAWSDGWTAVSAYEAMNAGKLSEAFTDLSGELVRCYRFGCWRIARQAGTRFALVCLKGGALEEAFFHAVVGLADELVKPLASAIEQRQDIGLIRRLVARAVQEANLRQHFVIASQILTKVDDLIPDEDIPTLARWFLPRCQEAADMAGRTSAMAAAWEGLTAIGARLPADVAQEAAKTAICHESWLLPTTGPLRHRKEIARCMVHVVHALPPESLAPIVEAVLPLALERIDDFDYPDVIELLCHLARRGAPEHKKRIADALYVAGKPVNRALAQMAPFFGKTIVSAEQLSNLANRISDEVRLQVQRLKPSETPALVPEQLMARTSADGSTVVTVANVAGLAAVIRHRDQLSSDDLARLVRSMLSMIIDPDNFLANREVLLEQLHELADRIPPELHTEVFRALAPSAQGEIHESSLQKASRVSGRVHTGNFADVQAMAMVCLAAVCARSPALLKKFRRILETGLTSADSAIRQGAYGAALRLPKLSKDAILGVVMGTRDADPTAAVTAFAALAERDEWALTRPIWRLVLSAARMAVASTNPKLRRHAGILLKRRLAKVPKGLRREAQALINQLAKDPAASVREIFSENTDVTAEELD